MDRLVLAKVLREEKKSSCGWKRQPDSYSKLQAAWNKLKELEEEHKASQKKKQNEKLNLEKVEMIKKLIDDINQLENEVSQERLNLRLLQLLYTRTDDLMKFDFSNSEKEKIHKCSKSYIICSKMMKQSPDWSKNELLNLHVEIIIQNLQNILT